MAKLTVLSWALRGAYWVLRQLITALAHNVHVSENEIFAMQTIYYEQVSFNFEKFLSWENVGISKTEAKLKVLELPRRKRKKWTEMERNGQLIALDWSSVIITYGSMAT